MELIYSAYITVLDLKLSWFYCVFTYKISDKFIIKVPQKTRIDLNNSVAWLIIQKQENTSHSDTIFVLAFLCYQLSLLLIRSSYLVHSHIHTPCTSSGRRPVLRITFEGNISKSVKKKKYWSYSISILFASISWTMTPINLLLYLNQRFLTFIKYSEHFFWLFFHQSLT